MTTQREKADLVRAKTLAMEIDNLNARLPQYAQEDATRIWEQWFGFAYAITQGWVTSVSAEGLEELRTLRDTLSNAIMFGVPLVENVKVGDTLAHYDYHSNVRHHVTVVKVHPEKNRAVQVRRADGSLGSEALLWEDWRRVRIVTSDLSIPRNIREVTA